jgi:hypothetical protein
LHQTPAVDAKNAAEHKKGMEANAAKGVDQHVEKGGKYGLR